MPPLYLLPSAQLKTTKDVVGTTKNNNNNNSKEGEDIPTVKTVIGVWIGNLKKLIRFLENLKCLR